MQSRKKIQRLLILLVVIIPGIIISILGLYFVSQQKTAMELNLKREHKRKIEEVGENIEQNAVKLINSVFSNFNNLNININNTESVLDSVKTIVVNNPVVRHPFIINRKNQYIFPITKDIKSSLQKSPDQAAIDKNIGKLYLTGRELEYIKKDIIGALKIYSECLKKNLGKIPEPYIINAIAGCYFKLRRYHQALYYYLDLLDNHKLTIVKNTPLRFTILRQTALSYKYLSRMESSFTVYLRLYELIVKNEFITKSLQFELYKNEALDYLSHYKELIKKSSLKQINPDILNDLYKISTLSRVINWKFVETTEKNPDVQEEYLDNNKSRFLKLKELYTPNDEKTWFYKTIRKIINFENTTDRMDIRSFLLLPTKKKIDVAFRKFNYKIKNSKYIFGFLISEDMILDKLSNKYLSGSFISKDLELVIENSDSSKRIDTLSDKKIKLLQTPFKNILNGLSLVLYSSEKNHYGKFIRKKVWINYCLIVSLIIVLILGTFMFNKYFVKETELLRSKAEFIDRVSHTLKTPLTRMRLMAENITSGWIKEEEKKKKFLKSIILETENMNKTIENMLNFSQIDAGQKNYNFKEISVKNIIENYLDNNTDATIKVEFGDNLPNIHADPDGVKLILSNLIQNSLKYSPDKKEIIIRLNTEGDRLKLEIVDRGIGIPAKDQKKIFEKFYRSHDEQIPTIEGSGLGLFIVGHIVDAHNGEIKVSSTSGEGSVFTVLFPINNTEGKK